MTDMSSITSSDHFTVTFIKKYSSTSYLRIGQVLKRPPIHNPNTDWCQVHRYEERGQIASLKLRQDINIKYAVYSVQLHVCVYSFHYLNAPRVTLSTKKLIATTGVGIQVMTCPRDISTGVLTVGSWLASGKCAWPTSDCWVFGHR